MKTIILTRQNFDRVDINPDEIIRFEKAGEFTKMVFSDGFIIVRESRQDILDKLKEVQPEKISKDFITFSIILAILFYFIAKTIIF